jgi:hypothetical protein
MRLYMPKPSRLGLEQIQQAIREVKLERGWNRYDPRWLVEASKLLEPERAFSLDGPYADGCSEGTWKRLIDQGKAINPLPFQAFCTVLRLDWQKILDRSDSTSQETESNLELKIGLSSEASNLLVEVLRDFEYITNAFLPKAHSQLKFTIIEFKNEEAIEKLREPNAYDIIMLDDPWIPAYSDSIKPLDEEPFFQSYLEKHDVDGHSLFGRIFLESFRQVCVFNNQVLGLPILGNVQLLIHRCDVGNRISSAASLGSLFDKELPYLDLRPIEDFYHISKNTKCNPLVIRDDTDNDKVETFWEILRALGHEDTVVRDAVVIDADKAQKARSWLYKFAHQMSFTDLQSSLLAKSSDTAVALGWPGWVSGALSQNILALSEIEFQRFTDRPVMGVWCFALPNFPANPELRGYAVRVMLALTADPNIQFILAKRGNIPVLANFPKIERLRQIPFWRKNYFTIRNALSCSSPRPRTKYWTDIEKELNSQIHEGHFRDVPGRLVFKPARKGKEIGCKIPAQN